MSTLKWKNDNVTREKALKYCPINQITNPASQYQWDDFKSKRGELDKLKREKWNKKVVRPINWPDILESLGPSQIITEFENQRYTHGLRMVIWWGTMYRTSNKYIWPDYTPEYIEEILRECSDNFRTSRSIEYSWLRLTEELDWSDVMTSKTLHFMCRSAWFS